MGYTPGGCIHIMVLDSRWAIWVFKLLSTKFGFIKEAIYWLSQPKLAFISTAVVDAWIGIPLVTMIFLSDLVLFQILYEAGGRWG